MGYRSNVVLELAKEQNDIFQALYVSKFPDDAEWLFSSIQKGNDKAVLYYFSDVKWYDSYPEISFIEEFLNELDEEHYKFARTGDEPDDIEEKGYSDAFHVKLYHEVSIKWDGP